MTTNTTAPAFTVLDAWDKYTLVEYPDGSVACLWTDQDGTTWDSPLGAYRRLAAIVKGREGKVVADREDLAEALVDEMYGECRWYDCGRRNYGPHSGTCPLADPEPAAPPPLPTAQVKAEVAAMAETVALLREDLEHAEEVAFMSEQSPDDIEGGPAGDDGRPACIDLMETLPAMLRAKEGS